MSEDLMLDVGLASEIKLAARKAGYTGADLKAMTVGNMMARLLPVLRGEAEVVTKDGQEKAAVSNTYLRRLYNDAGITIPVTGGQRLIADSKKVFTWSINGDFKNWGLMKKAGNTPDTDTAVFELYADATFAQFFGSFGKDLDTLSFTQDQIIAFCENHKYKLRRDGGANFFLMKQDDKFFVVEVRVHYDGGLNACVYQFESDSVWRGVFRHRVIVPATAL